VDYFLLQHHKRCFSFEGMRCFNMTD